MGTLWCYADGHKPGDDQGRRLHPFELTVLLIVGYTALRSHSLVGQSREPQAQARTAAFDALYESGVRALRAGQADEAIDYLTQAVAQNRESKSARCSLGQALVTAGRAVEAIEQFQRCAELDSHDVESQYNLGQAYLQLALTTAGRVLESSKTSSYARRVFAENNIGRNDLTEAETQYRLALESEPDAPDLRLALGGLYLRAGQPRQAREEFQRAVAQLPDSIVALYRLAEGDFLLGDFASALAKLRSVVRLNPQFLPSQAGFTDAVPRPAINDACASFSAFVPTFSDDPAIAFVKRSCGAGLESGTSSTASARTASGPVIWQGRAVGEMMLSPNQLCLAGLCEACDERLRGKVTDSVPDPSAQSKVGHCDFEVGNYRSAYRRFLEATKQRPQDVASLYWLQESARRLAGQCFERLRQIDPDSYLVHFLSAQAWEEEQRNDLAVREYKAAVARRPDAVNVRVRLGHLQWKWQQYDDALQQLTEALRVDPADPLANYLVGDIWVQKHEAERALPYLHQALSLRPGFLNAEASLGRALAQLGRLAEAAKELEAVAPSDADGSIHYQLQQIYLRLGKADEAKAAQEAAERIRSEHRRGPETSVHPDSP